MATPTLLHEWDFGDYHVRVVQIGDRLILENRNGFDMLGGPVWQTMRIDRAEFAEAVAYATYYALTKRLDEMVKVNG